MVASLASYPTDAGLLVVMEDPRLCIVVGEVREAMEVELKWLLQLDGIWEKLGKACGMNKDLLRSTTVRAGLISFAFVEHRALREVSKLPWSLCQGDIRSKLLDLAEGPIPEEPTAKRFGSS